MCKLKNEGGFGFRDLESFNMAMLTKQAWRIFTCPNLLLSRIIKAKYFPQGYILSANIGSRPSATWRSIFKVIPYLRAGIRRRIGNGVGTSIWADPWLKDGGSGRVFTTRSVSTAFPNRVADLINPSSKTWDLDIIKEVFWPIDQERILAIPIGNLHAMHRWLEDPLHVITECRGMDRVWRSQPFVELPASSYQSPWDLMEKLKKYLSSSKFQLATIIAWKAWDNRNKEKIGETGIPAGELTSWGQAFLETFKEAQLPPTVKPMIAHPREWTRPPSGVIKINFDAAVPRGELYFSIAAIARDNGGDCVGWKVESFRGSLLPVECEAKAALLAINMAKAKGWESVIIEGDYLQIISALRAQERDASSFGAILEDCLNIAKSFQYCVFNFVKRSGNRLAHHLAKHLAMDCKEGDDLPVFLADII
ncbi:PREDICTED: uncharacterized protein LOC105961590 [Erythranthe guttata]|uniref:uncharacterized protein LOC105961590 n=1 Tax=Erythranthe guttata TaxID=4155 RepID=UPI00064DA136|nr:PREDICTED: uncharacterized protein LOC105961590 [Erythranthe guttata]|eukprot:XP_012841270.1 PREDICTED: uncharacterized protein LOC105961590 [Erythranthe guttata]